MTKFFETVGKSKPSVSKLLRISRYLAKKELRKALGDRGRGRMEVGDGKVGGWADPLSHLCQWVMYLELTFVRLDRDNYRWLLQVKTVIDTVMVSKWTYIFTDRRYISIQPSLNIKLFQFGITLFNLRYLHSNHPPYN